MPELDEAERLMAEDFEAKWQAESDLPIAWNGAQLDPDDAPDGYVAYSLLLGDEGQAALETAGGVARFRQGGIVQVDVLAPKDAGSVLVWGLVKIVKGIYRRLRLTGTDGQRIRFRRVTAANFGPGEVWWRVAISAEFRYDLLSS